MRPELSVVVPMFDEEEALPLLVARLRPVLDDMATSYEVVAVDDGSTDLTPALLERARRTWPELRVVRLRANAGHQAALSAGLVRARGRFVVTLDADLQDPPEVVAEMLAVARDQGVDVVYGVRSDRSSDSRFKRHSADLFYRTARRLTSTRGPDHAGDFRLMSRATVDAVNLLPEHNRVLRLAVPALGFRSAQVPYVREERAAGRTKYSLGRMVTLSIDSFTGFSTAPLRLATALGVGGAVVAALFALYVVVNRLVGQPVAGWASTVVIVVTMGAVQLLCLGLLGEYIARMYLQMQGRPAYFVAYDSEEASVDASVDGEQAGTARPGGPLREYPRRRLR
jgi:polyisoprenyl-phosphate glycosyltransferase